MERGRQGRVLEAKPNSLYKVGLDNGERLLCHLTREARYTLSAVTPGDIVLVDPSPRDPSRGTILARLEQT